MTASPQLSQRMASVSFTTVALFLAANAALAVVMRIVPAVSTLHALVTLMVGLWFAWKGDTSRVTYIAAYIMGAEVLWRMTRAGVFWEFGKYALTAVLLTAIIRSHRPLHTKVLLYFVLLIPSAILTMSELGFANARDALSFNLSGPLAITVCIWYFSGVRPMEVLPLKIGIAALAPILGIATLTLRATVKATAVDFGRNSNFVTSDGFGPNQVSAALGIGAFLCFFFLIAGRVPAIFRALLLGGMAICAVQSAITFSRGGLYMAGGAAVGALIYLVRDSQARKTLSVGIPAIALLAFIVVIPRLDTFTGGALGKRFSNTGLTRRDTFIAEEAKIWMEHPFFGVGPGIGKVIRNDAAAHTEVTRMVAEHGVLGLGALLMLCVICIGQVRRIQSNLGKAFSLSLVICALLFMLTAALRIVAPAFLIGLSAIPFGNLHFGAKPGGQLFRCRVIEVAYPRATVVHG